MAFSLNRIAGKIGLGLVRFAARDSNMLRYAKAEWALAFPSVDRADDAMQAAVGESVFNAVAVFSLEGHSGGSAGYTIGFIEKALRFEPFSPLQGTHDEWVDVSGFGDGTKMWQNKRLSSVFQEVGPQGERLCYDIDGQVYVEPSGCTFTRGGARNYIQFPYVQPKTKYINVDEDGAEIPTIEKECALALKERAEKLRTGTNDEKTPELLDLAAKLLEKI